jgi:hypothetical protein
MLHITHASSLIFRAKSNGIINRIPQSHLEGAGGQVDQGLEGLHHVGGRVVQTIWYKCIKPNFWSQIQWKYLQNFTESS